jgi:hypothetical protein
MHTAILLKNVKKLFIIMSVCSMMACQTVKPYQRVYLNDSEMRLGQRTSESFERNAMTYREGASGGGSGKASGGCGCN